MPTTDASAPLRARLLGTLLPGFDGPALPGWIADALREGLPGVCVYGSNAFGVEQLRALAAEIRAVRPDALIAIDEEGGDVTRLYFREGAPYPGNALLGRIDDLALTEQTGRWIGEELLADGYNLTLAPIADVNSNPDNPVIGVRSFGSSPEAVSRHVAAWTRGAVAAGVAVSAKHFPGHGDTAVDSHHGLPLVDRPLEALRDAELAPFRAAIEAGAQTVMTSHILLPQLDPAHPATMSPVVLGGLLRGELGFEGVIVSDALDMKGASGDIGIPEASVRALAAGVDLLCLGPNGTREQLDAVLDALATAVADGRIPESRVTDAATRVAALVEAVAPRSPSPGSAGQSTREGPGGAGRSTGEGPGRAGRSTGEGPGGAGRSTGGNALPPVGWSAKPTDGDRPRPAYDLARIIAAFDRQPLADSWVDAALGDFALVRLESEVTPAITNEVPWGPFAAGRSADATITADSSPVVDLGGRFVAVAGRDIHRHPFARAAVDALRAAHGERVLVIDLGWPSDDRRYADVATFGASRLVGRALLSYLEGTR